MKPGLCMVQINKSWMRPGIYMVEIKKNEWDQMFVLHR